MSDNNEVPPTVGEEIYGDGKVYLENIVLDNLLEAFVELTAAVWVYHDRTITLERVLQNLIGDDHDVDISELVEQHSPSEAEVQRRAAEREKLIADVFRSFSRQPTAFPQPSPSDEKAL